MILSPSATSRRVRRGKALRCSSPSRSVITTVSALSVSIEETDKALTVVITDRDGEEHRNAFPRRTRLLVAEGDKIIAGTPLNERSEERRVGKDCRSHGRQAQDKRQ